MTDADTPPAEDSPAAPPEPRLFGFTVEVRAAGKVTHADGTED